MSIKEHLPSNYVDSIEIMSVQETLDNEAKTVRKDLEDLKKQFFVTTCTWGIDYWEMYVGLPNDESLPLELRRKAVIAKLSSQGTCTEEMIISMCRNFTGSDIEIVDHLEDYYITIRFRKHGDMENLQPLAAAINKVKPAWLNYKFMFTFTSHVELKKYTHKQLMQFKHKDIRNL